MPKTRAQKAETVKSLRDKLSVAKSVVFAFYEGLPAKDINEFRRLCKKENVGYAVAKKTLLKRAFAEAGIGVNPEEIVGNFAAVIGYEDEVAAPRAVSKFGKGREAAGVAGGVLENKLIGKEMVLALAALPSKQELLAKVVGSISSPLRGLVGVLGGNLRSLVYVLDAIKNSKS